MDSEIKARGVNFLYAKEFIIRKYGEDFFDKLKTQISKEASLVWSGPILSLSSYQFEHFKSMVYALCRELKSDEVDSTAEMYAYIADRSLNNLYKIFFRLSNPAFVLKNYPKLWDRFFTSGIVTVEITENTTARIKFELPEIFLDWLPGACYGFSKKAVEMAGGKNLKMNEVSKKMLDDGEYEIIYNLEWV
ncbi:MAG: hypothetical protein PHW02_08635 [bacterium]|nr:hypothetical protein [bacterium]